jgi:TonB family protein
MKTEPRLCTLPLDSCIHYPKLALENGLEADVTFRAVIEKDGSISKITILSPLNDTIFTPEAIRVIKEARFNPATLLLPIRESVESTIHFRLKDKSKK